MHHSIMAYLTSSATIGAVFGAVHGHKERKGSKPWLIPRDVIAGAIAYPVAIAAYPLYYITVKESLPCPYKMFHKK